MSHLCPSVLTFLSPSSLELPYPFFLFSVRVTCVLLFSYFLNSTWQCSNEPCHDVVLGSVGLKCVVYTLGWTRFFDCCLTLFSLFPLLLWFSYLWGGGEQLIRIPASQVLWTWWEVVYTKYFWKCLANNKHSFISLINLFYSKVFNIGYFIMWRVTICKLNIWKKMQFSIKFILNQEVAAMHSGEFL